MPHRLLRFCRACLQTQQALSRQNCGACGGELLPLLDGDGAISGDFLSARGFCCGNGCRNCPYDKASTAVGVAIGDSASGQTIEKRCPRCAARFRCGGVGCWCNKVRLSQNTLQWLERNYVDCLCPACLESVAVG